MRLVHAPAELADALAGARREAASAFGDGTLMLERLVTDGRHIEIQVFADAHGNVDPPRRARLQRAAPAPEGDRGVAVAVRRRRDARGDGPRRGRRGAGRRLRRRGHDRVHRRRAAPPLLPRDEHAAAGRASGHRVRDRARPRRMAAARRRGRAAAAAPGRDPLDGPRRSRRGSMPRIRTTGFAPQTGRIAHWRRRRAGVRRGPRLPRRAHRRRHRRGRRRLAVLRRDGGQGDRARPRPRRRAAPPAAPRWRTRRCWACAPTAATCATCVRHPEFVAGAVTTKRARRLGRAAATPINVAPLADDDDWAIAAALRMRRRPTAAPTSGPVAASVASRRIALACAGVDARAGGRRRRRACACGERVVDVVLHRAPDADGWRAVDGRRRAPPAAGASTTAERVHVARDAAVHVFEEPSPFPQPDASAAARVARAPVAGVVAQVAVEVGQRVAAGQPLVCVEAMKMEMWLNAAADGVVSAVRVALRDTVAVGRGAGRARSRRRRKRHERSDPHLRAHRRAHRPGAAPGARHRRADGRRGARRVQRGRVHHARAHPPPGGRAGPSAVVGSGRRRGGLRRDPRRVPGRDHQPDDRRDRQGHQRPGRLHRTRAARDRRVQRGQPQLPEAALGRPLGLAADGVRQPGREGAAVPRRDGGRRRASGVRVLRRRHRALGGHVPEVGHVQADRWARPNTTW